MINHRSAKRTPALIVVSTLAASTLALNVATMPVHAAPSPDSQWELETTTPLGENYFPTFTGNGYFAARVPAAGQGFSYGTGLGNADDVQTSFQINGFFTGRDVTDIADDSNDPVSKQWRVSGPGWTGLTIADESGSFDQAFETPCMVGVACQLEDAALSGGLGKSSSHDGYNGTGFVDNWGNVGATAQLAVSGLSAGTDYDVVVRYAAGWPGSDVITPRELTVRLGEEQEPVEFPDTAEWNEWKETRVTLTADAARTALTLSCAQGQDCRINVDQIAVVPVGEDLTVNSSTPTLADRGLSNYRQAIDLKTGTIITSATWVSPSGNSSEIEYTVFTDRSHDQRGVVRARITPQWTGELTVTDVLDARPTENVKEFTPHRDEQGHKIGLTTELNHTNLTATYASRLDGPGTLTPAPASDVSTNSIGQTLTASVEAGKTYEFVKYVGLTTSDDIENNYESAANIADAAQSEGYDDVRAANDAAWEAIWQGDIQVKGDDELQAQIRASRFYLLASVGTRSWSPSPTGLSSNNYGGHAFWDTETWMWPSLVAQNPDIAAGVLNYRSERLEDAKWNAKNTLERHPDFRGSDTPDQNNKFVRKAYEGVRFPWEGGYTGRESTESYFFGGHEIHVTADVALAFWQYYMATGDKEWLDQTGWPVISGTADFWVSRSTLGPEGQYHVLDVTPPDEWASNGNNGRDDNPYTNAAASKNLEIAIEAAGILGRASKPAWEERAGNYFIPMDDTRGVALEWKDYVGTDD